MKNYSLNFEDSKTFILNYKVEDNQIIVNLASRENYVIPYTLENEKILLERMKTQVLNSREFEYEQKKIFYLYMILATYCGIALPIFVIGDTTIPFLDVIGAGLSAFSTIYGVYKMIDIKRKIKDINKNKMFLNNEEILNEKVRSNQNILSNTDTKTKKLVSSTPEDKPIFSLNNMDKIKYKELIKILENIRRDEQFGFDYSSTPEDKPMVLTKKMTK